MSFTLILLFVVHHTPFLYSKVYLEKELSTQDGEEIHAPVQMELNWFILEELVVHTLEEEELNNSVYLMTLIILVKQQGLVKESMDKV